MAKTEIGYPEGGKKVSKQNLTLWDKDPRSEIITNADSVPRQKIGVKEQRLL